MARDYWTQRFCVPAATQVEGMLEAELHFRFDLECLEEHQSQHRTGFDL